MPSWSPSRNRCRCWRTAGARFRFRVSKSPWWPPKKRGATCWPRRSAKIGAWKTTSARRSNAAGCQIPRSFSVEILTSATGDQPFSSTTDGQLSKPAAEPPIGRLAVVKGKAAREEYVLDKPRINIGRMAELTDSEQRVVRRNDVVFEENADEANGTVSRQHAHIRREEGQYRVCRRRQRIRHPRLPRRPLHRSPKANRRGERLRAGDEIYFGRACLRFET